MKRINVLNLAAALGAAISAVPLLATAAVAAPAGTHADVSAQVTPSVVVPPRHWLSSTRHDWLAATETAFAHASAHYRAHHGLADYRRCHPLDEYRARYPFVTAPARAGDGRGDRLRNREQAAASADGHASAR